MNDRLFSLCTPCPDGFIFCREFRVRDFRRAPFALHAPSAGAAREFLGNHLSRLAGIILIPGDHYSSEEVAPLVSQIIFHPSMLPCLTDFAVHQLAQLDRYIDSEERLSFLTLENKRFELNNQRASEEFGRFRESLLRENEERRTAERQLAESEQWLRTLVQTIPDLIWLKDADGIYLACNTIFERVFGAREADIVGKTDYDFVDKELADFFRENDRKAITAGKPSANEEWLTFADDGYRGLFDTIKTPMYDADGRLIGVLGISRDITERKRAEEELYRLNRELRAVSNCNQILMRAEDEQTLLGDICRIVCDEAGYRMAWVGYAEHDDAKTVRPIAWAGFEDGYLANAGITWADTERGRGPAGIAIRTGETDYIRDFATEPKAAPWRDSALQRGYRSSIALPLKDESKKTFGTLTIYSTEPNAFTPDEIRLLEELSGDLSFGITVLRGRIEHKRAEEKLKIYREHLEELVNERTVKLEAANKELEAFSYSVSHDLRAPLRSIYGFSQALLEEYDPKLDSQGKDYLGRVMRATQRMTGIIEDLLKLSRITRAEMNIAEINLTGIAQSVIDELRKSEPQRNINIKIAEGLKDKADARLMSIALENLLGNAWKFTSKQPDAVIEFGSTKEGRKTVYFIRDNGAGFNMSYVDKLFIPFQRLHTEDEYPGTGIGLATVRRIIFRHGGNIRAEGLVNKGATFYFNLHG